MVVVIIKTRRYKRLVFGPFFAPETDVIFGDGVGTSLVRGLFANLMVACVRSMCFYIATM